MGEDDLTEQLTAIAQALERIEASLTQRSAPAGHVAQAIEDTTNIYGLVGQLVEVAHSQREAIEAIIHRLDRLMQALSGHDEKSETAREALKGLLVQLREGQRKHVDGLYDLERAVYGGETRAERARREGERGE